ncbi:hypothetical protein Trydic_g16672 [Trypoxylus dichotomus]
MRGEEMLSQLDRVVSVRTNIRPIKVILDFPRSVSKALRNSSKLRNSSDFGNIKVSTDHTPKLQHYNKLRSEMEQRNPNGERLRIRYVKGVSKLVPLN